MQKRKNRPAAQRPQKRTVAADGVYNNPIFIHAASSQLGNTVHLLTKSGAIYEGIFTTFSPQFDILLEWAHKVEKDENINVSTVVEKYIFKPSDIVSLVAKDVDPEFATRDTFETDTAISSRHNGGSGLKQKPLEMWDSTGEGAYNGDALDSMCLELDSNSNGWDADEMFQKNEAMYGVQSTFQPSLEGYTMQIQKSDSHDFRKAEQEAEKIAREIENQPLYDERADLENGDEEERYAAVHRPAGTSPHFGGNNNNNISSNSSKGPAPAPGQSQKYVVPAKRKGQQIGKLIPPQTPPAAAAPPPPPVAINTSQMPPQSPQQSMAQPPLLVHGGGSGPGGPKGHGGKGGYHAGPATPVAHNSNAAPTSVGPPPAGAPQYSTNINMHSNQAPPPPSQVSNNNNYHSQSTPSGGGPSKVNGAGENISMQQPPQQIPVQQQQPPPPVVLVANNQQSNINGQPQQNQQTSHPPPPGGHHHPGGQSRQIRSYLPQSQHMPPSMHGGHPQQVMQQSHSAGGGRMSLPPQNVAGGPPVAYAPDAPPPTAMLPPAMAAMVLPKGQPPHAIVNFPPHLGGPPCEVITGMPPPPQGPLLVVQPIPPPGGPQGPKMMPQRPPRGRDETVQDLKNFQENYVLTANPNASPGLSGPPPPMMHPAAVYAQQQPPPQGPMAPQDDMKSQPGVMSGGPSPQPASLPPPATSSPPQGGVASNGASTPRPGGATPGPAGDSTPNGQPQSQLGGEKQQSTEAKKSVLNPQAKPFTPRNPSTPNPSRPHTPQSAGAPQQMQVQGTAVPTMPGAPTGGNAQPAYQQAYIMQPQKNQYVGNPNRMRFSALPQSAVQAATGSPLTLPYMYPQHHAQHYPSQHYPMMTGIRMFTSDAQQQMQYLTPSPHSTTPSPGQAQYHPQPSQVGGGPSQPFPQAAGQQQFPIMPMIMPQPMVGQFHPNAQQPQYSNQFILMQPHNPAQ